MEMIVNGVDKDIQYPAKCQEYMDYIKEHIDNVKKAYSKLFANPDKPFTKFGKIEGEQLEALLDKLKDKVELHDSSKYTDYEFEGYRLKFYPTDKEKALMEEDETYKALVEAKFQEAWYNHFTHNDHHPNYWKWIEINGVQCQQMQTVNNIKTVILRDTPREEAYPMSPISILHMICDWEAMSMKFNSNTAEWWFNKAIDERKAMNPKTIKVVDVLVKQLFN